MKKTVLFLVFVVAFCSLFSQTTGRISGKVKDQDGNPIAYASVMIAELNLGAQTDENGMYLIIDIPPGKYDVLCQMMGYQTVKKTNVQVNVNEATVLNFTFTRTTVQLETFQVIDHKEELVSAQKTSSERNRVKRIMDYSVSDISEIVAVRPGVSVADGQSNYRGGRANEISLFQPDFNTEEYSRIKENDFFETLKDPMSTFGADVDAASYSNFRRFVQMGNIPHADVIRTEEMVNYFDYDYKEPTGKDPLSINIEYGETPWNKKSNLVHIGLKGKVLKKEQQLQNNLVFLIDVSGSMSDENKLPLLKRSFKLLVESLADDDYVSMVVYAGNAGLVLPPTKAKKKDVIMDALDKLNAGGSTAGGAGIELAYKTALENFNPQGNNRVILATDGDFNVGISNTGELVKFVEEKKNQGIFLTILGFGMYNYKDDRLQQLADKGNGKHFYIDNIMEAKKVLVNELTSTIYRIAKDTKIQVEFNPAQIAKYRLIGYENRLLENKDFEDNTKDAGEVGSGHTVTAIYEVIPANRDSLLKVNKTKYMESSITKEALNSDEILTVRIRYKESDGEKSKEFSQTLKSQPLPLNKTSDNFRFSAAIVELSNILRDSAFKGTSNMENVIKQAKGAKGQDENGYRAEFIDLCERVKIMLDENEK
jgi:Ca-activated chloride channel family protein